MIMSTEGKVPPHPLDVFGQWLLLEIAESANPPEVLPTGPDYLDVEMEAKDGWKVTFFYDGELDYIDHFVTPDGQRLDVWLNDDHPFRENAAWENGWPPIMNWRGVGDLARLREVYGVQQ